MKRQIKKVHQLERGQKIYIGTEEYTFKGMDGSYARLFDKDDTMVLASCGTLVEVEE